MARTLDLTQARALAREVVNEMADQNVQPLENQAHPNTVEHIIWMANEIAIGRIADENQANRWVGAVQWGLIFLNWSTLPLEYARVVRHSATDDYRLTY